jgi:isocitrate dehydrogenase (NAD+)
MNHTITVVPGDGIGPEVMAATLRVIEGTGVPVTWEEVEAGADITYKYGKPLPDHTLSSIQRNGVAIKGPLTTAVGTGQASVNVALRKALDLYACVRPVRNVPGVVTCHPQVDLVVIRENTEDLYAGIEHHVVPGVVETLKIISERASTRVARFAFEYAVRTGRRKVTAVHKANIMKLSDGLFLECCRKVARDHTAIEYDELIVDNACMRLVQNPAQFDVLVMENLYGDIISDIGAGLVGGLGLVPGANYGDSCAVFEAVHGSAPDIAGRGIANPVALILSAVLMLRHIGEAEAAERTQRAVHEVLLKGEVRTPDLGGTASTTQMAQAIIGQLQSM